MKRVIFCLLYNDGQFVLSRNFRQQRVGDINWVLNNYDLLNVSCGVDEIAILNVGDTSNPEKFAEHIRTISNSCFVPLSAGGGIESRETAMLYITSGADKLVLNTAFYKQPELVKQLAAQYGNQCIIASVDYTKTASGFELFSANQDVSLNNSVSDHLRFVQEIGAGEVLCQSVEKDGTGMGLELEFANRFLQNIQIPSIMVGGVGKAEHILQGLLDDKIDAVCTANLLSFIGNAFERSRAELLQHGVPLPEFSSQKLDELRDFFSS